VINRPFSEQETKQAAEQSVQTQWPMCRVPPCLRRLAPPPAAAGVGGGSGAGGWSWSWRTPRSGARRRWLRGPCWRSGYSGPRGHPAGRGAARRPGAGRGTTGRSPTGAASWRSAAPSWRPPRPSGRGDGGRPVPSGLGTSRAAHPVCVCVCFKRRDFTKVIIIALDTSR
jgi:hypothetical protein